MAASIDDRVVDEWIAHIRSDERAKQKVVKALRAKDESALRRAVEWVMTNLIKPALKVAWQVTVGALIEAVRATFGGGGY